MKNVYLYSALAAAVSIAATQAKRSSSDAPQEKCYGVAKAGENDCGGTDGNGEKQSCPGWAERDRDPYAWRYVPKGKCSQMGGKHHPPASSKKRKFSEDEEG